MSEWKETTLADLCTDISYGYTESAKQEKIGPKFLRITDIASGRLEWDKVPYCPINESDFEKYKLLPGDIVIARTGATTGANYTIKESDPKDVVFASYLIRCKINPQIANPYYIGQLLRSPNWSDYVDAIAGGSAQPGANAKQLGSFEFLLPSIDIQTAIASILSSLDDKIDLLHRQNATLEKMAETRFRQWFVEEDNDDTISQLISIQNGYAFKSKDFRENGIHGVIKIKNISDGIIDIEKTDFIENEIAKSAQERFKIRTGDILIAMTGAEIGKLGIIPKTNKNLWLNQRVGLLKEKFRGSKYLAYLQLKSEFGQDYIENTATGSAQPNISGTGIENCGFPKLSEKQIKEYSYQIGELFEKVIFNLGQIKTLTELRNMLLPKLMSGEIRVESHRDETSVETNNDTATLSPVGAAFKTIKHG